MAMLASPTGSESAAAADGPVLSLMNKRLRALRKKHNRILQMEASLAQGKTLNKEQEEVLRSKPGVIALIDEYEKLRSPLATAVQEEIARAAFTYSSSKYNPMPEAADESSSSVDASVEDLLALLYFGCLFDVKPQGDFASTMLTRTHERGCCLTYDYVTDDAAELLGEKDLDMISALAGLVTSRPLYSGISHRSALQGCHRHAKLWLQGAHEAIVVGSSVTYDSLRERLKKIMDSDYYTTTPEMKAPVDVAAAVGKYNAGCQVQVSESSEDTIPGAHGDDVPTHYHQQEDNQEDIHVTEITPEQLSPIHDLQKEDEDESDPTGTKISALQNEQLTAETMEVDNNHKDYDELSDQQHIPRRSYQNQRGGRGGRGGGGGRSHKGYSNSNKGGGGRNGWGGNDGYENGRNQYYDKGYHHPRTYYNPRPGRGGRGGGSAMYSYHGASSHGAATHRPSNVELGASA